MLIVADNLNVVDPVFSEAVERLYPEPILKSVRDYVMAGAQAIDINSGPLPKKPCERFAFLVETVQSATDLPLILDTTNAKALEAGLSVCRGKAIINGFSLEPARLETILPLARDHGADIIGYLLTPDGRVPMEENEMMVVAVELFEKASTLGLTVDRLIIDPVIAPVAWPDGLLHNQAVLSVLRGLPDLLGSRVRTIAGISNLGSGQGPRSLKTSLECAFLPMLAAAGLDMVLMNVFHARTLRQARRCEALLGGKIFSWSAMEGQ